MFWTLAQLLSDHQVTQPASVCVEGLSLWAAFDARRCCLNLGPIKGRTEGASQNRSADPGGPKGAGGKQCLVPRKRRGRGAQSEGFMGTSVWGVDSWGCILEGFY